MDEKRGDWIIGLIVKVKTSLGEELEGEIFSYDNNTNCVVLVEHQVHSTLKKNYRLLKTSFIKEIQYVGKAEKVIDLEPPPVNINKIRQKEAKVLRKEREETMRIGVGVSQEAQDVFNALAKTLPCKWKGESIIIFDEIIIDHPYNVENCRPLGTTAVALDRVKKVLEGERRKLKLPSNTSSPTQPTKATTKKQ